MGVLLTTTVRSSVSSRCFCVGVDLGDGSGGDDDDDDDDGDVITMIKCFEFCSLPVF